MSGSTFGKIFRITTWGESHGSGIGVVIDGCPSGISLNEEDIQIFLDRRKPGQSKFTTRRSEKILSRFSRESLKANDRNTDFSYRTQH